MHVFHQVEETAFDSYFDELSLNYEWVMNFASAMFAFIQMKIFLHLFCLYYESPQLKYLVVNLSYIAGINMIMCVILLFLYIAELKLLIF